jgi:hypothetical protein
MLLKKLFSAILSLLFCLFCFFAPVNAADCDQTCRCDTVRGPISCVPATGLWLSGGQCYVTVSVATLNLLGFCSSSTTTHLVDLSCCGVATPTPACFPAGTKISTPEGEKDIETLKAGEQVLSFDPTTGKMVVNEVGELITASGRQIRATAEHPFWVGRETSVEKGASLTQKISNLFVNFVTIFHGRVN